MERWKQIKDFPDYEISTNGYVKSFKNNKERILKNLKNHNNHLYVELRHNNERRVKKIHRLMAEAFIPNPENKPFVRHLNDIPDDNRLENLAWGDHMDNVNDAINNGKFDYLSKPIIAIKNDKIIKYRSIMSASRDLGIKRYNIESCIDKKSSSFEGVVFKSLKPRHTGKGTSHK